MGVEEEQWANDSGGGRRGGDADDNGATSEATDARIEKVASSSPHRSDGDAKAADSAKPDDYTHFPDPIYDDPTALETASWWAEFASIHGVYYMLERGHFARWKKLVWAAIVLTATGGMIWALVEEFRDFFEYNVTTTTRIVVPSSLPFPQVTVCNANRFSSSLQNETGILEPRNEEELLRISQPAEEFIRYTRFNGVVAREPPSDAWDPVVTPFGRCYTFSTDERVFVPGGSSGLTVWTWLNQSDYEEDTLISGIQVFVAQKGTPVTEQAPGVLVPPGAASSVQTRLLRIRRETEEPWRRCDGSTPEYSNQLCRAECINAAAQEKCGCRPIGDDRDPVLPYCNSSDDECMATIDYDDLELCDMCSIPPCEEEVYVTAYSSGRVALKAAERLDGLIGLQPGEISNNLVQVNVNYESIRYEETTETKSTSVAQLMSNLGGIFGFFMGISMISIVEFFGELLCLRMLPRLWGDKRLYGIGQRTDRSLMN